MIRSFENDNYYHVFNRGNEKRQIFLDKQDYQTMNYYMSIYLAPLDQVLKVFPATPIRLHSKNLNEHLALASYCLMPNHFHFLFKQLSSGAISKFMKQLLNAYTLYFNNKYDRTGNLMHGRFKAIEIKSDEMLLHVSRYIHLNPLVAKLTQDLKSYPWSSFPNTTKGIGPTFLKTNLITDFFSEPDQYNKFVMDQAEYALTLDRIKHLTIDTH